MTKYQIGDIICDVYDPEVMWIISSIEYNYYEPTYYEIKALTELALNGYYVSDNGRTIRDSVLVTDMFRR